MKDIDDKDLVDVSGGGDRAPSGGMQKDIDLNQPGGTGDEGDDGTLNQAGEETHPQEV